MSLTPSLAVVAVVDENDVVVADVASLLRFTSARVTAASFEAALTTPPTSGSVVLYDPTAHDDGMQCLEQLVLSVATPVVAFAHEIDVDLMIEAVAAGARGYIAKACTGDELGRQLERVAQGGMSIDAVIGDLVQLVCDARQLEPWPAHNWGLTRRESDVLGLLVKGLTNRQIADDLIVGQETVKSHLHAIYRKLNVGNRRETIAFALDRLATTRECASRPR